VQPLDRSVRKTVSRAFSRFRQDCRIATPFHGEVVFLDRPWLEELAGGAA
jgi:hypothetical protein